MTKLNFGGVASLRVLAIGMAALGLAACGGGETEGGETAAGGSESGAPSGPANLINAFEFHAPDTLPLKAELVTSELSMSGGCAKDSPMSVGFRQGMPSDENYFSFSFDSARPVVAGQKGDINLTNVTWDNGSEVPEAVAEDSGVRVPTRMEGFGIMTIEAHTGAGMNGHMRAIVTAVVESPDGEVPVEAHFDINLACAPK